MYVATLEGSLREAMGLAAMFRHYLCGDYNLEEDPNRLIQEADSVCRRDMEKALALVGRAESHSNMCRSTELTPKPLGEHGWMPEPWS